MSLFQCEHCGCKENTALSWQGFAKFIADECDWTGIEDRRGKKLCSACGPSKFKDGRPTECGQWHGQFERVFLPKGEYQTAANGNLERIPPAAAAGEVRRDWNHPGYDVRRAKP